MISLHEIFVITHISVITPPIGTTVTNTFVNPKIEVPGRSLVESRTN
jgi:hypothetical protein